MNDRQSFFNRAKEMFRLYRLERYQDALAETERLAIEFPEEKNTTTFWHICLLSRTNQTSATLSLMQNALADDQWWSENQLRGDSDLDPLQGLPEFERMLAVCNQRHAAAQQDAQPHLLVRQPEPVSQPTPLLIALHARGSSPERDLHNWLPVTQIGWLLAMPQSSQLGSPDTFVWDDEDIARNELISHYETLCRKYQVDANRIILAGFSQGGARAIHFALEAAIPVHGFLSVVPGRIMSEMLPEMFSKAKERGLRGYIISGGQDERYELFVHLHVTLLEYGIPCKLENHSAMGHEFPENFDRSLEHALEFIFKE